MLPGLPSDKIMAMVSPQVHSTQREAFLVQTLIQALHGCLLQPHLLMHQLIPAEERRLQQGCGSSTLGPSHVGLATSRLFPLQQITTCGLPLVSIILKMLLLLFEPHCAPSFLLPPDPGLV